MEVVMLQKACYADMPTVLLCCQHDTSMIPTCPSFPATACHRWTGAEGRVFSGTEQLACRFWEVRRSMSPASLPPAMPMSCPSFSLPQNAVHCLRKCHAWNCYKVTNVEDVTCIQRAQPALSLNGWVAGDGREVVGGEGT